MRHKNTDCVLTRATQGRKFNNKHTDSIHLQHPTKNNSCTHYKRLYNCSRLFRRSLSEKVTVIWERTCLIQEEPPSWSGSALPQVSIASVSAAWTVRVLKNTGNLTTTRWKIRWDEGVGNLDDRLKTDKSWPRNMKYREEV